MNNNLFQYLSKKQKFFIIFIPALIIIIIITSFIIHTIIQESQKVSIINLDEKTSSAPIIEKDLFRRQLKNVILLNPDIKASDIKDAVIRDGSYSEEIKNEVTTAKFIIDIDSIKQSYVVNFSWSNTENIPNNIFIECPTIFESKYPDSNCVGMYTTSSSPELYLPYKGTTKSGIQYEISVKQYNGGNFYFEVSTKDCQNLDEAKAAAEVWLNTTPLKSLYPIEVKRFCN